VALGGGASGGGASIAGASIGGAAIGGAADAIYTFGRGDIEAALPAGSRLTLRTTRPITLRTAARTTTYRRRR
jgi:hypothetical protein